MPKIIIDGKNVHVRWLKEWDKQIVLIGKTFKNKAGFVDWQTAFSQGYMKGLPVLKFQDYSHRLTAIKARRKPGFLEQRREYNRLHKPKQSKHGIKIREDLFRGGSLSQIRKEHKCPPRDLWSDAQHDTLKILVGFHPRGDSQVDWEGVMQDKLIKRLPLKYRHNLPLLRKYYHGLCQHENPKLLKKRRKDALRWRNENKSRYLKNALRRKKQITKVTNEFLISKIPVFS